MKYLLVLAVLILSGCETTEPYYEVGVGYALESGDYNTLVGAPDDRSKHYVEIDEKCAIGHIAFGVEFEYGISTELSHYSCFNQDPEISSNVFMVKKRGYFK